jgi:hypothetical protein
MRFPGLNPTTTTAYIPIELNLKKLGTDESTSSITSTVDGWPTRPQRAVGSRIWIIGDLLLLLMPTCFICECHFILRLRLTNAIRAALAALAYSLDGKELSNRGRKVQEATLIGPTLFPLFFSALAGRSLKKIGLWRAQEGTTLGVSGSGLIFLLI